MRRDFSYRKERVNPFKNDRGSGDSPSPSGNFKGKNEVQNTTAATLVRKKSPEERGDYSGVSAQNGTSTPQGVKPLGGGSWGKVKKKLRVRRA